MQNNSFKLLNAFVFFLLNLVNCHQALADMTINEGDCVSYPVVNLSATGTLTIDSGEFESVLNDSKSKDEYVFAPLSDKLDLGVGTVFCRCDDISTRQWILHSEYEGNPEIASTLNGYDFLEVEGTGGEELPFYVGTRIYHTGKVVSVPNTTYASATRSCTKDNEFEGIDGVLNGNTSANRTLRVTFRAKTDVIPAGYFSFTLPTVVSYRRLAPTDETNPVFTYPETYLTLSLVNVYVHEQCELTDNTVYSVSLGAVDLTDFDDVELNQKPTEYEPKAININFSCNGDADNKADFYLLDSNDVTNESTVLSTTLDGVGIVVEGDIDGIKQPLNYRKRYDQAIDMNATDGSGTLMLEAYPVKTSDDIEAGIYRGKATLVIENH
ncbi:fimbrial protein [Shewanella youngdeokensis]|uniref:Fimbrial protein n=1 Tax=Shewanella youngdeokensis TaxID=2999068 RepID=A0ABZ0K3K3_9GAMM|nr:fimbrial protein [Shewanella sp. DAU334]